MENGFKHKRNLAPSHCHERNTKRSKYCCDITTRDHVKSEENDDEKVEEEVERKIMALQRIVPGGESLEIEKLFEETAGYILALQGQVKAIRLLTTLLEGFQKQEKKLGG